MASERALRCHSPVSRPCAATAQRPPSFSSPQPTWRPANPSIPSRKIASSRPLHGSTKRAGCAMSDAIGRKDAQARESIDAEMARRIMAKREQIIRDPAHIDIAKWDISDDTHLLKSPLAFRDELLRLFERPGCQGDKLLAGKTHGKLQFRPHE